jgi:hypothetical protein
MLGKRGSITGNERILRGCIIHFVRMEFLALVNIS